MKKIIISLFISMLWAVSAFGATGVKTTIADVKGKYVWLKVLITSDGTDAAAVDIVANADTEAKRIIEKGFTAMITSSIPGSGGVAPDNSIDIIFTDINGLAVKTTTGDAVLSSGTVLKHDMSSDYGQSPAISSKWYITCEDIGTSGDQYTLIIFGWVETK